MRNAMCTMFTREKKNYISEALKDFVIVCVFFIQINFFFVWNSISMRRTFGKNNEKKKN